MRIKTLTAALLAVGIAGLVSAPPVYAKHHHPRHHVHRAQKAPGKAVGALKRARLARPSGHHRKHALRASNGLSALIALINYKLARYVHPTGKCAGASEWLATYYWQGHRTATGEHYNPHGLSAAHRTLPFGTRLQVTNPHNGRTVAVRVNDRGPFTHANIDLSLGAAKALGMNQSSYVCVVNVGRFEHLARGN